MKNTQNFFYESAQVSKLHDWDLPRQHFVLSQFELGSHQNADERDLLPLSLERPNKVLTRSLWGQVALSIFLLCLGVMLPRFDWVEINASIRGWFLAIVLMGCGLSCAHNAYLVFEARRLLRLEKNSQ
jgi:hypothetical protein